MISKQTISVEEVLYSVRHWPAAKRVQLMQQLAATFNEGERNHTPPNPPVTLDDIWALLPTDMPQLTDEEIEQIKEQRRLEKYG